MSGTDILPEILGLDKSWSHSVNRKLICQPLSPELKITKTPPKGALSLIITFDLRGGPGGARTRNLPRDRRVL